MTSGCVVHGRARVGATVHAEPALVEVSPGVMVIEDYDEPVFYSDGYYWLYSDGVWLRSSYHTGGWVRVRTVPTRIVSIRSPRAYVRYRGRAGVRRTHVRARGGRVIHNHPRDGRHRDDDRRRRRHHH
ncbi:MAG TPA: hypothetical protein VFU21_17630 [Kofleriaceae bacterium]|nr:hypothetical protein [Kofleriaceae bacterium]